MASKSNVIELNVVNNIDRGKKMKEVISSRIYSNGELYDLVCHAHYGVKTANDIHFLALIGCMQDVCTGIFENKVIVKTDSNCNVSLFYNKYLTALLNPNNKIKIESKEELDRQVEKIKTIYASNLKEYCSDFETEFNSFSKEIYESFTKNGNKITLVEILEKHFGNFELRILPVDRGINNLYKKLITIECEQGLNDYLEYDYIQSSFASQGEAVCFPTHLSTSLGTIPLGKTYIDIEKITRSAQPKVDYLHYLSNLRKWGVGLSVLSGCAAVVVCLGLTGVLALTPPVLGCIAAIAIASLAVGIGFCVSKSIYSLYIKPSQQVLESYSVNEAVHTN